MRGTTTYDGGCEAAFPEAARYRGWLPAPGDDAIAEPGHSRASWPYSERHVQCVWFDSRHRPHPLSTEHGQSVWVIDPGIWNQEAGPDFIGAVVEFGAERRRIHGDVEVHIHPAGWNQHAHRADPRYREVRVHVTWFPGTLPESDLPPGAIQISLARALGVDPAFSLGSIDTTAYPYAARAASPPCATILRGWHPDQKEAVLVAAGQERLRRKAERLAHRMREVGEEQAVYEEVLAGFGYKHNKSACRKLAGRVPLAELRSCADGDPLLAYAILLGVAALVPPEPAPHWDHDTRQFFRRIWHAWWRVQGRWEGRRLAADDWRLAGLRPANHPRRRLMAAARLFTSPIRLPRRWATANGLADAEASLTALNDPYWDTRLSLGGTRQDRPIALLGRERIRALLVNAFIPYRAAIHPDEDLSAWMEHGPIEEDNEIVRRTAHYLFGPDHPPSLYRTGLRRQGLLQIFQDFCLNDRSRCGTCPLPDALRRQGGR